MIVIEDEQFKVVFEKKYGIGMVNSIEDEKKIVIWFNYSKFLFFIKKNKLKIVHYKKHDMFRYWNEKFFFGLKIDLE